MIIIFAIDLWVIDLQMIPPLDWKVCLSILYYLGFSHSILPFFERAASHVIFDFSSF